MENSECRHTSHQFQTPRFYALPFLVITYKIGKRLPVWGNETSGFGAELLLNLSISKGQFHGFGSGTCHTDHLQLLAQIQI